MKAMKKIIGGKIYDTEKADQIIEMEHGMRGDFDWFLEALYVTKKGILRIVEE